MAKCREMLARSRIIAKECFQARLNLIEQPEDFVYTDLRDKFSHDTYMLCSADKSFDQIWLIGEGSGWNAKQSV